MKDAATAPMLTVPPLVARRLLRWVVAVLIAAAGAWLFLFTDQGWREYPALLTMGPGQIFATYFVFCVVFLWLTRGDGRQFPAWLTNFYLAAVLMIGLVVSPEDWTIFILMPLLCNPKSALFWWLISTLLMLIFAWNKIDAASGSQATTLAMPVVREEIFGAVGGMGIGLFFYALTWLLYTEAELSRRLREAHSLLADQSRQQERQALTLELHDSLGHHLTALRMQLVLAVRQVQGEHRERLMQALSTVERLLIELRSLVEARSGQESRSLLEQLRSLVGAIVKPDVRINLDASMPNLPQAIEKTVFRLCQEALTNAIRHSDAERLEIAISFKEGRLRTEMRDNGSGCDSLEWGNGLRGMRERVERCGGTFEVHAGHGEGFAILAEIPLEMV
jgi:signal transduction histidine kinase